jgi:hypothetical protein
MSHLLESELSKVVPVSSHGLIGKIRFSILPIYESLEAKVFLTRMCTFLEATGLTHVSALIMDNDDIFPPKDKEVGSVSSALAAGLAEIERKEHVGHVSLVAEGKSGGYETILAAYFTRRHPRDQHAIFVNISIVWDSDSLQEPKDAKVGWREAILQERLGEIEKYRSAIADEYSKKLAAIFPETAVTFTDRI